MTFLGEPSHGVDKIKNILFAFGLYAVYIFIFSAFMEWLWAGQIIPFKLEFFMTCLFAPAWEELAFRWGPIMLVKDQPKLLLPVIVCSSILFGVLHGGPMNIMIQGVMGFILSLVFIKNGYSYWSVVALHSLWNLWCLTILEKLN